MKMNKYEARIPTHFTTPYGLASPWIEDLCSGYVSKEEKEVIELKLWSENFYKMGQAKFVIIEPAKYLIPFEVNTGDIVHLMPFEVVAEYKHGSEEE